MGLRARLSRVLEGGELQLGEDVWGRLEALESLLEEWSRAVDLTGFGSVDERDRRYFAEPLAALRWVPERGRALDIGTGGGSPALPLAIARPELEWVLIESNRRKAVFLEEAARTLGLSGVRVEEVRYEAFSGGGEGEFACITLRGVALGEAEVARVWRELQVGGRLLWFGGRDRLSGWRAPAGAEVSGPESRVAGGGYVLVARKGPPSRPSG